MSNLIAKDKWQKAQDAARAGLPIKECAQFAGVTLSDLEESIVSFENYKRPAGKKTDPKWVKHVEVFRQMQSQGLMDLFSTLDETQEGKRKLAQMRFGYYKQGGYDVENAESETLKKWNIYLDSTELLEAETETQKEIRAKIDKLRNKGLS